MALFPTLAQVEMTRIRSGILFDSIDGLQNGSRRRFSDCGWVAVADAV
jgi:hypothetical protein